jgi:glycosyltransferase involved in cell wall biosynthesis
MTVVSVVIPTRGRPDLIGRSVRAVLANDHADFDVVVVDQSDDDRTGEIVRALAQADARLRYVHTMPPGLSRAYNVGIRMTAAPVLAFTDDDCVAARDWISSVARAFEEDPGAEMLYGTVALPPELRASAGEVPILPIASAERLDGRNGFRIYGMGANYALRRSLFERIGGFDEILGGGGPLRSSQDFDFQFRAYRAGAVVLLRPEVIVEHYGLRTPEQWPSTLRAYCIGNAAFYAKHIRCGDRVAAARLGRSVLTLVGRQVRHLIDRSRPSQAAHLRAYLDGTLESLRYPIDRARRLYLPRSPVAE